jgi:NADP-dependent 3-hydroxy acid dehydrogenase YdfG
VTSPKQTRFTRKFQALYTQTDKIRGVEPLTPEDIAEVIVFAAGRRENVVIADTLIFPNHQASAGHVYKKP